MKNIHPWWHGHGTGHGFCRGKARTCPGACPRPMSLSEVKKTPWYRPVLEQDDSLQSSPGAFEGIHCKHKEDYRADEDEHEGDGFDDEPEDDSGDDGDEPEEDEDGEHKDCVADVKPGCQFVQNILGNAVCPGLGQFTHCLCIKFSEIVLSQVSTVTSVFNEAVMFPS